MEHQVAVRLTTVKISGVQPAVRVHGRGRLGRVAVIALHHAITADQDFTDLGAFHIPSRFDVDDPHLDARNRLSLGGGPLGCGLEAIAEREDAGGFGHSASLQDLGGREQRLDARRLRRRADQQDGP